MLEPTKKNAKNTEEMSKCPPTSTPKSSTDAEDFSQWPNYHQFPSVLTQPSGTATEVGSSIPNAKEMR